MLFVPSEDINDVWELVARATSKNELGVAAKVQPKAEGDGRKERLVCIYSVDFKDKKDVERVLDKLRQLRLVEARGKPVYYKPGMPHPHAIRKSKKLTEIDAYTYLGIASGNPWGLRASIYSSRDF
jgi:hypothetical protein